MLGPHASRDAADATQEAWLTIVRRINRLSDPALFAPWAHRIVGNKCADLSRVAKRQQRVRENKPDIERSTEHADGNPTGIREAIAALSFEHRTLVSMRYGSDLSIQQIAQAVGIPEGTVKSRLHAARETLKNHMEQH